MPSYRLGEEASEGPISRLLNTRFRRHVDTRVSRSYHSYGTVVIIAMEQS
ncbi:MAG: hypothetical protein MSH57_01615 [Prevotella sp.]|nr:hypothetical protein [Prevotella sp.]